MLLLDFLFSGPRYIEQNKPKEELDPEVVYACYICVCIYILFTHLFIHFYNLSILLVSVFIYLSIFYLFISRADIPSREKNEVGVCQRLVCQKRVFAVRSSSCEV